MTKKKVNATAHIAARVRAAREARGMLLQDMAKKLEITNQALSKAERGAVTMTGARLYEIARVLKTSPAEFFAGLPGLAKS